MDANIIGLIFSQAKDVATILKKTVSRRSIDVQSTPTEFGWTKLNSDGSANGNPKKRVAQESFRTTRETGRRVSKEN